MKRLHSLFELVVQQQGSDLHLVAGHPPYMRLSGDLVAVPSYHLGGEETTAWIHALMPDRVRQRLALYAHVDFAHEVPGLARFRMHAFRHMHGLGAVCRVIPSTVPTFEVLGLPSTLSLLGHERQGLIVVTGPRHAGKSTTLAALLSFIADDRRAHIITIEEPIEFVYRAGQGVISQREIGWHAPDVATALRAARREDPDVIFVSALPDLETLHLALTAAEAGCLVLGTCHTPGAVATLDRLLTMSLAGEQAYLRLRLSRALRGVISQQLVRRADGKGQLAAVEIFLNTSTTAELIREGCTDQLPDVLERGALLGMQSLDTSLRRLYDAQLITGAEAHRQAMYK